MGSTDENIDQRAHNSFRPPDSLCRRQRVFTCERKCVCVCVVRMSSAKIKKHKQENKIKFTKIELLTATPNAKKEPATKDEIENRNNTNR